MAVTKFSCVYKHEDGTIFTTEFVNKMSYKTAELIAKESAAPNVELVCVVESWKLYPNKNEKTEKKDKMDDTKQGI